jgi:hypothetical protein
MYLSLLFKLASCGLSNTTPSKQRPAKNASYFLNFSPMFVPSLSWQSDRFKMCKWFGSSFFAPVFGLTNRPHPDESCHDSPTIDPHHSIPILGTGTEYWFWAPARRGHFLQKNASDQVEGAVAGSSSQ